MSGILSAFVENEAAIKRFLSRFFARQQDVEDIAQETFLRAFAAEATQCILRPKAFLFKIAKNLALNERARIWTKDTDLLGDSQDLDVLGVEDGVKFEERIESREKLALLAEAVSMLPPQCRKVFLLRKIHGLSQGEIASQLGISVGTVEKHITSGLKRCSEHLHRRGYYVGTPSAQSGSPKAGLPNRQLAQGEQRRDGRQFKHR